MSSVSSLLGTLFGRLVSDLGVDEIDVSCLVFLRRPPFRLEYIPE